ncbi:hypothetical protein [Schumannella sp. 10F1B-5-1]|uniref:hypothetical protein n=1 Tax=Schumannella sp. 10F1B-5-1 TaxID=2590780 RepID=UPI001132081D|nr:hypothetical protein [Schumannella sp. 10F1B-5-1]TPW78301.1 hypothetical protein FJ658_00385 [Schumannella sp. 10F1B-5-1]
MTSPESATAAPRLRRRRVVVPLALLGVVLLAWLASCTALQLTGARGPVDADRGAVSGSGTGDGAMVDGLAGFRVTGSVAIPVAPGVDAPVDVRVENPYAGELRVTGIQVDVTAVLSGGLAVEGCSADDFTVVQSAAEVRVPEGATRTLSQLAVPSAEWPRIALASATRAPEACRGVELSLAYRADGEVR